MRIKESGQEPEIAIVLVSPRRPPAPSTRRSRRAATVGAPRRRRHRRLGRDRHLEGARHAAGAGRLRPRPVRPAGLRRRVLRDGLGRRRAPRPAVCDAGRASTWPTFAAVKRQTETGYDTVELSMPAVLSVSDAINEPRYPSLPAIMGASASRTRCCRWPMRASTPARSAAAARAPRSTASRRRRRGRLGEDRGRRHRGREDPGLPRRAQGRRLMAGILVLAERQDGAYSKGSLGLIEEAARLGAALVRARARPRLRRRRRRPRPPRSAATAPASSTSRPATRRPRRQPRRRRRRRAAGDGVVPLPAVRRLDRRVRRRRRHRRAARRRPRDRRRRAARRGRRAYHPARRPRRLRARALRLHDAVGVVVVRANTFAPADESAGSGGAEVVLLRPELRSFSRRRGSSATSRPTQSGVDIGEADCSSAVAGDSASPRTSASARTSRTRSAAPSPPPAPSSTRAGTRTPRRSARPASRCRRSATSRAASPARSSTRSACSRRR